MNLTKQLIDIAETKIIDSYLKAQEAFKVNLTLPTIIWEDMGRTAGRAWYNKNQICLSPTLYFENQTDFVERTVVHEVAHLVTGKVFPQILQRTRTSHHGLEWRHVMRALGVDASQITRCHSYDTSNVSNCRPRDKWLYTCPCGQRFELDWRSIVVSRLGLIVGAEGANNAFSSQIKNWWDREN